MWSGGSIWAAATSWRSAVRSRDEELLFERAEVADVVGVAVDPGDGVVVGALVRGSA